MTNLTVPIKNFPLGFELEFQLLAALREFDPSSSDGSVREKVKKPLVAIGAVPTYRVTQRR